ncbi:MAG: adenylyl-sulfate kinase, partial [Longimicrobiales bacterium]
GSFILIDPHTNATVAAGMIRGGETRLDEAVGAAGDDAGDDRPVSPNVTLPEPGVGRAEREARHGHGSGVVWLTGRPGAGKSTVARALERHLFDAGVHTVLLDGDAVRHGLCGDLGFSADDRAENIRRVGEVAGLFADTGHVVIAAFVSPYRRDRDRIRELVGDDRFVEVEVTAPEAVLVERDPKGLYAAFAEGRITGLTGMDAPYEAPVDPALTVDTSRTSVAEAVAAIVAVVDRCGMTRYSDEGGSSRP